MSGTVAVLVRPVGDTAVVTGRTQSRARIGDRNAEILQRFHGLLREDGAPLARCSLAHELACDAAVMIGPHQRCDTPPRFRRRFLNFLPCGIAH